jgi:hypothetical protein
MAYEAPDLDAVNFELEEYTAPSLDEVNFEFFEVETLEDNLTLSDEVSKEIFRTLSETLKLSDGDNYGVVRLLKENLRLSDNFSKEWELERTYQETIKLSDIKLLLPSRLLKEEIKLTDAIDFDISRLLKSTLTLSDNELSSISRTLKDTLTLTDSVPKEVGKLIKATINLSDNYDRTWELARVYSDTLTLDDGSERNVVRTLKDTIKLSDIFSKEWELDRVYSDTLRLTDELSKDTSRELEDSLLLKDEESFDMVKLVKDTLTLGDEYDRTWELGRIYSDTLTLTDGEEKEFFRTLFETLRLTDEYGRTWELARTYSDIFTLEGVINSGIERLIKDNLILSEEFNTDLSLEFLERINLSDDYSRGWEIVRTYKDVVELFDGSSIHPSRILTEEIRLDDEIYLLLIIERILKATLTLGDTISSKDIVKEVLSSLILQDKKLVDIERELKDDLLLDDALYFGRFITLEDIIELSDGDTINFITKLLKEVVSLDADFCRRCIERTLRDNLILDDGETANFINKLLKDNLIILDNISKSVEREIEESIILEDEKIFFTNKLIKEVLDLDDGDTAKLITKLLKEILVLETLVHKDTKRIIKDLFVLEDGLFKKVSKLFSEDLILDDGETTVIIMKLLKEVMTLYDRDKIDVFINRNLLEEVLLEDNLTKGISISKSEIIELITTFIRGPVLFETLELDTETYLDILFPELFLESSIINPVLISATKLRGRR